MATASNAPLNDSPRVLVAEDDPAVRSAVTRVLELEGYRVTSVNDGAAALAAITSSPPDVVVMDVMMPFADGLTVCREARIRGSRVPILLLTAKHEVNDRVAGLDAGADDYLAKPFDLDELLARIRALLRRAPLLRETVLHIGDLAIDTHTHEVRRAGKSIPLTGKEYALLEYLALRQGAVVGREEISEHVWDEAYDPFSNLIEVYVQRLRRKLDVPGAPRLLQTRRGEGYRLAVSEEGDA